MSKSKYKNYYIGVVIAILIILAILYYFKIYETAKMKKYASSYLVSTGAVNLSIEELKEVKQVFSEAADSYFVFISFTNDVEEYKLENKLKPIIDNYGLKDIFYFVDTTAYKEDDDLYDKLNETFNLNKDQVNSIPIIIYFKDKEYKIVDPKKL